MGAETKFFSIQFKNSDTFITSNLQTTEDGVCLKQKKKYRVHSAIKLGEESGEGKCEDFALGKNHILYYLDEQDVVWQYEYYHQVKKVLFKLDILKRKTYLKTAFCENYAIIAQDKIEIFSMNTGQRIWNMDSIGGKFFEPLAIETDGKENVYIVISMVLEEKSQEKFKNRTIEGSLGIIKMNLNTKQFFLYEHTNFNLGEKIHLSLIRDLIHIKISKEGEMYVLNAKTKEIFIFSKEGTLTQQKIVKEMEFPSCFAVDGKGELFLGESRNTSDTIEHNNFIFHYDKSGNLIGKIHGMRGKIDKIDVDFKGKIFVLSKEENAITIFDLKNQVNESEENQLTTGTLISCALDSGTSETIWHRFSLNFQIPKDTQLKISYFTSEEKVISIDKEKINLDDFIINPKIDFPYKLKLLEELWSKPLVNPRDSLICKGHGRYLWFKIEFVGSQENTPLVKNMRVYYPRVSYLRYLPAIYQNDKNSKDFLERYLSIFETFLMNMEEKIDHASKYFDEECVSGDFLKWLLGWMNITDTEEWGEEKLRELLKNASRLYKKRGTREGLEEIITIYTGCKPFIIEYYQIKESINNPEIEAVIHRLYGMTPYTFCVLIQSGVIKNIRQRLAVEKIINSQKPAFTEGKLIVLEPMLCLDSYSYLGINSNLTKIPKLNLDGKTAISNDISLVNSVLEEEERINQKIEIQSKLI